MVGNSKTSVSHLTKSPKDYAQTCLGVDAYLLSSLSSPPCDRTTRIRLKIWPATEFALAKASYRCCDETEVSTTMQYEQKSSFMCCIFSRSPYTTHLTSTPHSAYEFSMKSGESTNEGNSKDSHPCKFRIDTEEEYAPANQLLGKDRN